MDNRLVVHGGCTHQYDGNSLGCTCGPTSRETWILDLATRTWRQHTDDGCPGEGHTGTLGLTNEILVIGGYTCSTKHDKLTSATDILHVMLEPKSLQQLAMHMVYKCRNKLPLKCLPPKLIRLMDID